MGLVGKIIRVSIFLVAVFLIASLMLPYILNVKILPIPTSLMEFLETEPELGYTKCGEYYMKPGRNIIQFTVEYTGEARCYYLIHRPEPKERYKVIYFSMDALFIPRKEDINKKYRYLYQAGYTGHFFITKERFKPDRFEDVGVYHAFIHYTPFEIIIDDVYINEIIKSGRIPEPRDLGAAVEDDGIIILGFKAPEPMVMRVLISSVAYVFDKNADWSKLWREAYETARLDIFTLGTDSEVTYREAIRVLEELGYRDCGRYKISKVSETLEITNTIEDVAKGASCYIIIDLPEEVRNKPSRYNYIFNFTETPIFKKNGSETKIPGPLRVHEVYYNIRDLKGIFWVLKPWELEPLKVDPIMDPSVYMTDEYGDRSGGWKGSFTSGDPTVDRMTVVFSLKLEPLGGQSLEEYSIVSKLSFRIVESGGE